MDENEPKSAYNAATGFAVAFPDTEQVALRFSALDDDPDLVVMLPARAVGTVVAELSSAMVDVKLADNTSGAMLPMLVTGARRRPDVNGDAILLLQLDGRVDLAVRVDPKNLDQLIALLGQMRDGGPAAPPRRH